jgi:hypothetical protein
MRNLGNQVYMKFNLPEAPLFGLLYHDTKSDLAFLQAEKKVLAL